MSTGAVIALLLTVVAVVAFSGRLGRVREALGFAHLAATGHLFLVVGYLLGLLLEPHAHAAIAPGLRPLVAFVAGWVGFAVGMRFEVRVLRPVPARAFFVALAPAVAAATLVGVACWPLLRWGAGASGAEAGAASLVLAAAAANSGPLLPALLRRRRAGRSAKARATLRMIEFSATFDDAIVVALAVVGFALFRAHPDTVPSIVIVAISLGAGVLLGLVTMLLLGGRTSEPERLLLALAMLAFSAGIAGWLYLSPAAVAAVMAFVLVNLAGERFALLLSAVRAVERPAVVTLMTVIGFHIAGFQSWTLLGLLAAMTVVRLFAKVAGAEAVARPIARNPALTPTAGWGLGLVPQGNLGLMVALTAYHVWADDVGLAVLAAVAIASFVNELLAPMMLARAIGLGRGERS